VTTTLSGSSFRTVSERVGRSAHAKRTRRAIRSGGGCCLLALPCLPLSDTSTTAKPHPSSHPSILTRRQELHGSESESEGRGCMSVGCYVVRYVSGRFPTSASVSLYLRSAVG